jgi:hypothetical protein
MLITTKRNEQQKYSFVVEKKRKKTKMGKLKTYAMLIAIYIQIFKIFCFFNQFVVVINQKLSSDISCFYLAYNKHVDHWLIWNNCDDYIQVFHL